MRLSSPAAPASARCPGPRAILVGRAPSLASDRIRASRQRVRMISRSAKYCDRATSCRPTASSAPWCCRTDWWLPTGAWWLVMLDVGDWRLAMSQVLDDRVADAITGNGMRSDGEEDLRARRYSVRSPGCACSATSARSVHLVPEADDDRVAKIPDTAA